MGVLFGSCRFAPVLRLLQPGGYVLVRDYAAGDLAQERLREKEQKISDNFFVRGDGTVSPRLALPCLALPCLAVSCLALSCLALPCLGSGESGTRVW